MDNIKAKVHMSTTSDKILELLKKGFSKEFQINEKCELTYAKGENFSPHQVKIIEFFRFEGESDPDDESILYALETENGVKGILSHIYGRELSVENQLASEFMKKVRSLSPEHPMA